MRKQSKPHSRNTLRQLLISTGVVNVNHLLGHVPPPFAQRVARTL